MRPNTHNSAGVANAGEAKTATVRATRIHHRDGKASLIVDPCPHCGGRHLHGAPFPEFRANDGHRIAHCLTGDVREYVLREIKATAESRGAGAHRATAEEESA